MQVIQFGVFMKNILELLEMNAEKFGNKTAYKDVEKALTYSELLQKSKGVGSALKNLGTKNRSVAIYLDKGVNVLTAMFGIVYSGNFYVVIDSEMPAPRINAIFETLKPVAVVTDNKHIETASSLDFNGKTFIIDEIENNAVDNEFLTVVRNCQIDTDPLYALFTSGSTGVPKGAVVSHKSVLAYSKWACDTFNINSETVFGNQTPFYFSMSVTDVFSTLRTGATLVIIPKAFFTFPIKLIEFLNDNKVNTIYWVPSAMSIVANLKLFKFAKPLYLKTVLFAGEVMPTKQLNYWINNLDSNIVYANLYGPTETTDICTYYVVNRQFSDDEPLPIGTHCNNCDVMIVNDKNELAQPGEEGELFVRGSFLANGYYNNPEKTKLAFVQNPLNNAYPEMVYKTGDLVRENENGEIMYITRKDFQIKRSGYRIELGEIETAVSSLENIDENACVFDDKADKIILFYCGRKVDDTAVRNQIASKLPSYFMPDRFVKLKQMPHNQNGKIDRKNLKNQIN